MPISDAYVVQYLLQETSRTHQQIIWQERTRDGGGYIANLGNTEVALQNASSRSGSYLVLRFRNAEDEFSVREPAVKGWLGRKYSTPDERDLAESLQRLMVAVVKQCNQRRLRSLENPDDARDRVYRRLLFEEREEAAR